MQVFIKILKIIAGIVLGLVFSFVTIVCLEMFLPKPNPFRAPGLNLWLIGPIVAGWLFLILLFLLRTPSSKKIHTQGIEDLPLSISEFINGVIDAMRYRRSVRAEVRQELTDHFTDALADCQTEEEKQKATKELMEAFGDVKLLGTLLRRAKKRCRPLWRTIMARSFQFIGICFLLLIFYVGWFFTGKPKVTTNYLEIMNRQVRPVADDSQNAWPCYKQAAKSYVPPKFIDPQTGSYVTEEEQQQNTYSNELIKFDKSPRRLNRLSEEELRILNQWLADNQQALDLIHQGSQRPYYWRIYNTGEYPENEMMAVMIPNLSEYKDLARLLCWRGIKEAGEGHFKEAFASILETYSLGQHIRGQNTTLIEQLVAMASESLSTNTLRILLNEYSEQINNSLISQTRQRFKDMIETEDFRADFSTEKLLMYDETQRCFTESRFGKSHLYLPRLRTLTSPDILDDQIALVTVYAFQILFTHPDREQTLKAADAFYNYMENIQNQTPAAIHIQNIDFESNYEKLTEGNLLLQMLAPALNKLIELSYRNQIHSYGTLTILAIIEYKKEYGQYPDSLDELVKKQILTEIPTDPFSDQSLVYQKTDDDFLLYSVGANFTDDGGTPATDDKGKPSQWGNYGDWIFWPVDSVSSQQ